MRAFKRKLQCTVRENKEWLWKRKHMREIKNQIESPKSINELFAKAQRNVDETRLRHSKITERQRCKDSSSSESWFGKWFHRLHI